MAVRKQEVDRKKEGGIVADQNTQETEETESRANAEQLVEAFKQYMISTGHEMHGLALAFHGIAFKHFTAGVDHGQCLADKRLVDALLQAWRLIDEWGMPNIDDSQADAELFMTMYTAMKDSVRKTVESLDIDEEDE